MRVDSRKNSCLTVFILITLSFSFLCNPYPDTVAEKEQPFKADLFIYLPLLDIVSKEEIKECFDYASGELKKAANIQISSNKITPWRFTQGINDAFINLMNNNTSYSAWSRFLDEMDIQLNSLRSKDSELSIGFVRNGENAGRTRSDKPAVYVLTNGKSTQILRTIVLHEIAHQFGAIDLKNTETVMDGVFLTSGKPMPVSFKTPQIEIIKLASTEIQKIGKFGFYLPRSSPEIAEKVIPFLRELLPDAKDPHDVLRSISEYYKAQNDYMKTIQTLEESIRIYNTNHPNQESSEFCRKLYADIAYYSFSIKQFDRGMKAWKKAYDSVESVEKYESLSLMYLLKNDTESCLTTYRKILNIQPESGVHWNGLGGLILRSVPRDIWQGERIEEAKQCFEKAIQYDEQAGHYGLGFILFYQGSKQQANSHLFYAVTHDVQELSFEKKGGPAVLDLSKIYPRFEIQH